MNKPTNILEAYSHAFQVLMDLSNSGLQVSSRPARSREDPITVKKYSGPDRLPPHLWIHVEIEVPKGRDHTLLKLEQGSRQALNWLGVTFDYGGIGDRRDWELDWSFRFTGEPDGGVEADQDLVDEIADQETMQLLDEADQDRAQGRTVRDKDLRGGPISGS